MNTDAHTPNVQYFTANEYNHLRTHCVCVCTHTRGQHDHTQYCLICRCKRYGRRLSWSRGRKAQKAGSTSDTSLFESEGVAGEEHHACMYFDDVSEVVEACGVEGENVGTIEVPLRVVDITWRADLRRALHFDNARTEPAAHYFERGCYMTMPLVLCAAHRAKLMSTAS